MRRLAYFIADHEAEIAALVIFTIAASTLTFVVFPKIVIPAVDAAADATAQFIRSIRHGG